MRAPAKQAISLNCISLEGTMGKWIFITYSSARSLVVPDVDSCPGGPRNHK